jgi:hypothetical protein
VDGLSIWKAENRTLKTRVKRKERKREKKRDDKIHNTQTNVKPPAKTSRSETAMPRPPRLKSLDVFSSFGHKQDKTADSLVRTRSFSVYLFFLFALTIQKRQDVFFHDFTARKAQHFPQPRASVPSGVVFLYFEWPAF